MQHKNDHSEVSDKLNIANSMKKNDKISINNPNEQRVNILIQTIGPDGTVKQTTEIHNAVSTAGKNMAADQLLASPTLGKPTHMAMGIGTPGATLLGAENARVAFDSKTRSGNVVTMQATFGAGVGTATITEAGIFDVVTANTVNMLLYASGFSHTKGAADSLVFTWTLTVN